MVAKRLVVGLSCGVLALGITLFVVLEKTASNLKVEQVQPVKNVVKQPVPIKETPKFDLYSTSFYDMPLASVMDISKLPKNVKKYIDTVFETAQGFYYLNYNEDERRVKIILQNPITEGKIYTRHGLEVLEITLNDDETFTKKLYPIGYNGEENEIENAVDEVNDKYDIWAFDKSTEPYLPLKHKKYNDKGKLLFTEKWDFSVDSEIKYQMKNSKNKTISILKETLEDSVNLRREHIFYDENGQITTSVTVNFDGANITRFTYYNPQLPEENITIISEYSDGMKVGETVYNQNYQPIKIFKAQYIDGKRVSIELVDKDNKVLDKIN